VSPLPFTRTALRRSLVAMAVAAAGLGPVILARPAVAAGCSWSVGGGSARGTLVAVDAGATDDAWAVGYSGDPLVEAQVLVQHWNGSAWHLMAAPGGSSGTGALYAVTVLAPDDVWAVGSETLAGGDTKALTIHWDGHTWSRVAARDPGRSDELFGVAGSAPDDVWAVGNVGRGRHTRTLAMHWDGSSWSVAATPNPNDSNFDGLSAVAALSSTDVWAVGGARQTSALAEHWNGLAWTVVPSPAVGPFAGFAGVTALTPDRVWAVGARFDSSSHGLVTLTERWNGSAWETLPSPNVGRDNVLSGIAFRGPGDLWAVGSHVTKSFTRQKTLIEHWDGRTHQWSVAASPSPTGHDQLFGVAHVPHTHDLVAVGSANARTLVERAC
jgi:hypothetical protein